MNKRKIALGPGAASLILIVVVLSLCMLAMLTQIASRNDFSLASRSAEMITRVYELSDRSERRLAELPEGSRGRPGSLPCSGGREPAGWHDIGGRCCILDGAAGQPHDEL